MMELKNRTKAQLLIEIERLQELVAGYESRFEFSDEPDSTDVITHTDHRVDHDGGTTLVWMSPATGAVLLSQEDIKAMLSWAEIASRTPKRWWSWADVRATNVLVRTGSTIEKQLADPVRWRDPMLRRLG